MVFASSTLYKLRDEIEQGPVLRQVFDAHDIRSVVAFFQALSRVRA